VIRSRRGLLPLRGLVVVAAVGLAPVTAGCEAGFNAPTQQWHQPTPGASAVVSNTLRINNMFVLGPAPGHLLPRGGTAGVFLALANDGAPDRLMAISAPGAATSVQVPAGGIRVGSRQLLLLTGPEPRILLQNLTRTFHGGQFVKINMEFLNAGHVTLLVPVLPRTASYGTFSPAPLFLHPKVTLTPMVPGATPAPATTPSPVATG
jgi:hypothetical protein